MRTDGQLYDILVDGAVAGDVIVLSGESKHEFTMAVYDKFFSREVGDSALKEFLAHNVKWPLETVVRVKNRRQAGIVHWLERNGFSVSSGECGKSNVSMVRSS